MLAFDLDGADVAGRLDREFRLDDFAVKGRADAIVPHPAEARDLDHVVAGLFGARSSLREVDPRAAEMSYRQVPTYTLAVDSLSPVTDKAEPVNDLDLDHTAPTCSYDLVLATHALVQAEQDPGIPSRSWNTFERAGDGQQQADFERRTGIGPRLDRVSALLSAKGRMILFEKTRQLARRVPLQRALAARDLGLIEQSELIRYRLVEEVADDGPLYMLGKGEPHQLHWDESPEPDEGHPFDRTQLKTGSTDPDAPLYANHWPSAQRAWEQLHDTHLLKEITSQEPDGRQLHIELGRAEEGVYLYCANTLDQRQLVIVEPARTVMLESYYQEIASGISG